MTASSLPHAMAYLLNDVGGDKAIEPPPPAAGPSSVGSVPPARYTSSSRYETEEINFATTASILPHAMTHLLTGASDNKAIESPAPVGDFQHHREVHAPPDDSEDGSEINIPSTGAGHASSSAGSAPLARYASSAVFESSVGYTPSVGYVSSIGHSESEMGMDQNIEDDVGISSGGEADNMPWSEPAENLSVQLPKASTMSAKQPKPAGLKRQIDETENASDDDESCDEPINKRPRQVDRVGGIIGTSRSSQSTRNLNKKVKDGTFVKNTARWALFKNKILVLDKEAEFDVEEDPRKVRHSVCTKISTMEEVYHVKAFKDHIGRCKGITKSALKKMPPKGIASLKTMFAKQAVPRKVAPLPKIIDTFCPGINPSNVTPEQRVQIINYMMRTPSTGGGAQSLDLITETVFPGRSYCDLDQQEKNEIRATQSQQHRWKIYSDDQKIYSTSCIKKLRIRANTIPVPACSECTSLFEDRGFKIALGRPIPQSKNAKFTPKVYIDKAAVEKYGRMSGLGSLLDEYTKVSIPIQSFLHCILIRL